MRAVLLLAFVAAVAVARDGPEMYLLDSLLTAVEAKNYSAIDALLDGNVNMYDAMNNCRSIQGKAGVSAWFRQVLPTVGGILYTPTRRFFAMGGSMQAALVDSFMFAANPDTDRWYQHGQAVVMVIASPNNLIGQLNVLGNKDDFQSNASHMKTIAKTAFNAADRGDVDTLGALLAENFEYDGFYQGIINPHVMNRSDFLFNARQQFSALTHSEIIVNTIWSSCDLVVASFTRLMVWKQRGEQEFIRGIVGLKLDAAFNVSSWHSLDKFMVAP